MLTSDYMTVSVHLIPTGTVDRGVYYYTAAIYTEDDLEFKASLPDHYPLVGFLPQLAADVFRMKICPCRLFFCVSGKDACKGCIQTVTASDTKSCVICFEPCTTVGAKCMTCVDGVVCRDCLWQCKDQSACPVCKVVYRRFLKRVREERVRDDSSDDE